jgi:hypothetical protein
MNSALALFGSGLALGLFRPAAALGRRRIRRSLGWRRRNRGRQHVDAQRRLLGFVARCAWRARLSRLARRTRIVTIRVFTRWTSIASFFARGTVPVRTRLIAIVATRTIVLTRLAVSILSLIILTRFAAIPIFGTIFAAIVIPVIALVTLLARRLLWLGARIEFVDVVVFESLFALKSLLWLIIVATFTARLVFLEARTTVSQHPEIVIGKLEVILGQHPVTGLLRIARKRLVFLEHLRGIAPRTIIDPVAIVLIPATTPAIALRALTTTAATAAVLLTIVYQECVVLTKGNEKSLFAPVRAVVSEPPDDQPLRRT